MIVSAELHVLRAIALWPHRQPLLTPLLTAKLDWDRLIADAKAHRLVPPLCAALQTAPAGLVPDVIQGRLAKLRLDQTLISLRQMSSTSRLVDAFAAAGIGLLVIKGVALSVLLYGQPDQRGSVDIDLLVDPAHLAEADRLLRRLGYEGSAVATDDSSATLQRIARDVTYKGHGETIELHWRLANNPHLLPWDFAMLWRTREIVRFQQIAIPTLGPRARLSLYLAYHGIHHGWQRLRWLADIALLLARPDDLAAAYAAADRDGLMPVLLHTLAEISVVLDVPMPLSGQEQLRDRRRAARIGRRVTSWQRWRSGRGRQSWPPHWVGEYIMEQRTEAVLRGEWRYRLAVFTRLFVSKGDREALRLPLGLRWTYPLLRPILLLSRTMPHGRPAPGPKRNP